MLTTLKATRGMVVAPHHLAAQAGLAVLRDGGNAVEAMVAAAATVAVVYPHMNALGGDNFWLIVQPSGAPTGIDACGAAATKADISFYRKRGFASIPSRGPLAALTVAGAVSGWRQALAVARDWGGALPLARLFEDAEFYARAGFPVTASQHNNTRDKLAELKEVPGFAAAYLADGKPPAAGASFKNPALARTFKRLADNGLDDFYRGGVTRDVAADLARVGSPLAADDLARHQALVVEPLSVALRAGTVYNMPPPTQGLASLILLGVFERLGVGEPEGFEFMHGLVEATKCAFRVRDRHVTDPAYMKVKPADFLTPTALDGMAAGVDQRRAASWPESKPGGDTVWLGAIDGAGRAVSFIQS
ncbi:MAG: gamma-glutamyltransferase family protein, partial [Rhodospirillales bacterium]